MASPEELRTIRKQKLQTLNDLGINAYPSRSASEITLKEVSESFDDIFDASRKIIVAGRIMSLRGQGAILFVDLFDGTGRFQVVIKKDVEIMYSEEVADENVEDAFELFKETVDIGDFIECAGPLFMTQREVPSMELQSWRMLTKALMPIPSEHFGIKDDDARYRKRYLDILLNPELREIFEKKARFWNVARSFFIENNFTEVETPTIELTTGGAEANPFKTHHKDFDLNVYLRISVGELWQKRLMAGGFPRTFEIGRVYRNEGSSPEHAQEFTNLEFYMAYTDYLEGMDFIEELYRKIAQEVFGKLEFTTRGHTFNLGERWEKIDYCDRVKEMTGIDVMTATEDEMKAKLDELKVKYDGENRERLIDTLWKYCRKSIAGPAFLINHPKIVSPLSKSLDSDPEKTERFQPILAGSELGNGFSELNDPQEQRRRFEEQQEMINRGDDEAMMPEWEFVEMLEYGIPPTFGFGFGERLFAFLVDKPIREIQLFPLMKPREEEI